MERNRNREMGEIGAMPRHAEDDEARHDDTRGQDTTTAEQDTRDAELRQGEQDVRDTEMRDSDQQVRDAELPREVRQERFELLSREDADGMNDRWEEIQRTFIDDPRHAVAQAERLVADVMQEVSNQFLAARRRLEEQWDSGGEASTEDLRQAMQQYRAFFRRLLTI